MSFCSDLKRELCLIKTSECCTVAECYGFLLCSKSFSYREMLFITAFDFVADKYIYLLKNVLAVFPTVTKGTGKRPMIKIRIEKEDDRKRIMQAFSYSGNDNLEINGDVLKRDCCLSAFVRGIFLSCGQMSDPNKNYRAELVIRDLVIGLKLYTILLNRGLSPKRSIRGTNTVIYFNKSETAGELLTLMGAGGKIFEYMDVCVTKDFRNNLNRKNNIDLGNIGKQVEAAAKQCEAIEILEKAGRLTSLPQDLYDVALLRRNNPNATLKDLTVLYKKPISRSGIDYHLRTLVKAAESIKGK